MYTFDERLTKGCDIISKKYCDSYNELAKLLDNLLSGDNGDLDRWDLSAFGLHLCKFFEQEINSSVIQLLREYIGIKMPDYYCRRDRNFDRDTAAVNIGTYYAPHYVRLNDFLDRDNKNILKQIPLGDAYYVMETCVDNDTSGWFDDYPVLKNAKFREIWRSVHQIRNRIAHSGSIVKREDLISFFESFKVFLDRFMPTLKAMKQELAPEGWKGMAPESEASKKNVELIPLPWALEEWGRIKLPLPTIEDFEKIVAMDNKAHELFQEDNDMESLEILNERQRFSEQFNWFDIPFKENGFYGLKDFKGEVIIPARYDDFGDLHHYMQDYEFSSTGVSVAQKNGKVGFVKRYSGEELTGFDYDTLYRIPFTPYYYFRKDGSKALGIITNKGEEKCPCIIDNVYEITNYAGFLFKSGEKYGYYSMVFDFCILPIYDEIVFEDLDRPLIFIIDGKEGQIDSNGTFYTKEELKRLEEEDEVTYDRLEFIMEYEG